jgi:hypothetical protein
MTDVELARALENGEIDNVDFKHFHHLHVGWAYLSEHSSVDDAIARMRATLRKFAASAGLPQKYHETITIFWMRILSALWNADENADLQNWVELNPQLLEKDFPFNYYSRERLLSDAARLKWVEPDLKPLPKNANELGSSSPARDASHWNLPERVAGK